MLGKHLDVSLLSSLFKSPAVVLLYYLYADRASFHNRMTAAYPPIA
jgi:hypothetical protein